jgi:hypothetical protein
VPSPQVAIGAGAVHFGLRWQVTPVLFAWGVNRKVARWRTFVVEPGVRQGGAVEFFVSPELLLTKRVVVLLRPGVRAYFPLVEHGEALSLSLGLSYQRVGAIDGVALEAGAFILFGILGVQVSWAPGPETAGQTIVTLRVRYF